MVYKYDFPIGVVPKKIDNSINEGVIEKTVTDSKCFQDFTELTKHISNSSVNKTVNSNRKHSHYFKDVKHLEYIDVYRVLELFTVTNPCLQHAIKKLLVAGGRGAGKDLFRDVQEAIDSLNRFKEMFEEDNNE